MKMEEGIKLGFDDVLIVPKRSEHASRKDVSIKRHFKFKYSPIELNTSPIISANMDSTGTFKMCESLSKLDCLTALHKFYPNHELGPFLKGHSRTAFYTLGFRQPDRDKFKEYIEIYGEPELICIDVPNAYIQTFVDYCAWVRSQCPFSIIMAGNVTTPNMASELFISGKVDLCKVGLGCGAQCLTRLVAGVGYGQLSAIDECSEMARGLHGHICADGGMKNPADVNKGLCAGADFCMLGTGMLGGTNECDGEWEYEVLVDDSKRGEYLSWISQPPEFPPKYIESYTGLKRLKVHGMSSKKAMEKHYGEMHDYKSEEGMVSIIPHKGPVKSTIQHIFGGIRSCCTYIGSKSVTEMSKCASFVRVTHIK